MSVEKLLVYGNPNIGVYVHANDKFALIPRDVPEKFQQAIGSALRTPVYRVTLSESPLIGVFAAGNSRGLILGRFVRESEVERLKELLGDEVEIAVLEDLKESAVGNLIIANDKAALVSNIIPRRELKTIEDVLGGEVVRGRIAGSALVGSMAVVSNRGMLVCPLASEEELRELSEIFHVKADVGTVNKGSIFIRSGLAVNDRGGVVGYDTTGPELMRIQQIFFS